MDLYEHQGKDLFREFGIPLAEASVAESAEEARGHADRLGGRVAVKAQVQIGGRGKAGGIALVDSAAEAETAAEKILTDGFGGTPVTRVHVALGGSVEGHRGAVLRRDHPRPNHQALR